MSQDLPPPKSRNSGCLRKLVAFGGLVLLLALVAGNFVRREMGSFLARQLNEHLSGYGVFVAWESARWTPGIGIRFDGLSLFSDAARSRHLATVEQVTVVKEEPGWNQWERLRFHTTESQLRLGSGDVETIVDDLSLQLQIRRGQLELSECRGAMGGVRFEIIGTHRWGALDGGSPGAAGPVTASASSSDRAYFPWLAALNRWARSQPKNGALVLKAEFHSMPNESGVTVGGSLTGNEFRWVGQTWDALEVVAKGAVGMEGKVIEINRAKLGLSGRTAQFSGQYDLSKKVLRIEKLQSSINLLTILRAFVPGAAEGLGALTSTGSWRIDGSGEIPVAQPKDIRCQGAVALDGELAWKSGKVSVPFRRPAFNFKWEKQEVSFSNVKAALWEGRLSGAKAKIRLGTTESRPRFDAQFTLEDARLESLMSSFEASQKQPGTVRFDWSGGGALDAASFSGNGRIGVHGAEFFRIPLVGSLSRLLDKLTPGFGRDQTSELEAVHRTREGTLHLENLTLDNEQAHIEASGSVDLIKQYAELTAQARLKGIVGLAATPVVGRVDAVGKGPVGQVEWERVRGPSVGVVGRAANVVTKTGGAVVEGTGAVVKGARKVVRGVLSIPGKLLPGN